MDLRGVNREFRRSRTSLRSPAPVVHAVRDVSTQIQAGGRWGLVGESGSGKSTLLRLVSGLDRPTSGEIEVEGQSIHDRSPGQLGWLRRRLQVVFQDPMSSLDPRMTVRQIVAEPLRAQRIGSRSEQHDRVAELLAQVGLRADHADRYPHQFSGGQRQRISLARALAPRPHILVADEPVSALDVSVRAQVLNLIDRLVAENGLTLILVSHDLSVVRHLCDRIAVMQRGQIVEEADAEPLFDDPQHPYTRSLLASIPRLQQALAGRTALDLAQETLASAHDQDSAVGSDGPGLVTDDPPGVEATADAIDLAPTLDPQTGRPIDPEVRP